MNKQGIARSNDEVKSNIISPFLPSPNQYPSPIFRSENPRLSPPSVSIPNTALFISQIVYLTPHSRSPSRPSPPWSKEPSLAFSAILDDLNGSGPRPRAAAPRRAGGAGRESLPSRNVSGVPGGRNPVPDPDLPVGKRIMLAPFLVGEVHESSWAREEPAA